MTTQGIIDKTWPEAFRARQLPKKITVVPIKMLQEKLQELRGHFENTRPLLPKETRPFTYQKEKKEIKKDEKGQPVLSKAGKPVYQPIYAPNGRDHLYEWVTEPSVVRLRRFGIPEAEEVCHTLSRQMRELKQLIMDQGYDPIDYGMSFTEWDVRRRREEEADARAEKEAEAKMAVKAEVDAKEAEVKAKADKKRIKEIAKAAHRLKDKPKKMNLDAYDEEFSKIKL